MRTILVTGGAGFIGSALVRHLITHTGNIVINVDKLTYAGHLESLSNIEGSDRYHFENTDICSAHNIRKVFAKYRPDSVLHLAAESHVDRSIDGSSEFIRTNIQGTHTLLEEARFYYGKQDQPFRDQFRFLHVSTDEVYGSLGSTGFFTEDTAYDPRSPYSASKASSDHLVRAWFHTYGLPVIITNCSNNYGPYQFPEKLIPVVILKALQNQPIPVYGNGENIRDWLYVDDHIRALLAVIEKGIPGETYNIGGNNELKNIDVVTTICELLNEIYPHNEGRNYHDLIEFVTDRPGHDFRYAIDASKINRSLKWEPRETFNSGIRKTIQWYLGNMDWVQKVTGNHYTFKRMGKGSGAR